MMQNLFLDSRAFKAALALGQRRSFARVNQLAKTLKDTPKVIIGLHGVGCGLSVFMKEHAGLLIGARGVSLGQLNYRL
jgi:hypothetical protein